MIICLHPLKWRWKKSKNVVAENYCSALKQYGCFRQTYLQHPKREMVESVMMVLEAK